MTKNGFLEEVASMLLVDELNGDQKLEDLAAWDSLQALTFIAYVQGEFDVVLEGNQVAEAKTVDDLVGLVAEHLED